jgi:protein dithiol:quinone oxidoreductase
MKKTQTILLITAITSLALVGVALYLQFVEGMMPCPLCVIQRYAFILLAIGCFIGLLGPTLWRKIGCTIGLYASISGIGVAAHQLYVIAHPEIKCGVDPVQTAVNNLPFANWLPSVFLAEGMCGVYYDPLLGLSIPQWSLVWFVIFTVVLLVVLFKAKSIN